MSNQSSDVTRSMPIPKSKDEALQWLLPLLDLDSRALHRVVKEIFNRGWAAISFLYLGLHPDGSLERGDISKDIDDYPLLSNVDPRLIKPYYKESGWPVVLVPIAEEALRRYENGDLEDDEYYCCAAQLEGLRFRNPELF